MSISQPSAELDGRYSSSGAAALPWHEATTLLDQAALFWLSTVRPDGRPHVTPLLGVWLNDTLLFCTGAEERKAKNLAENAHCVLTTGCNTLGDGVDLVVEGDAARVTDEALLQRVADRYEQKYGSEWHFDVRDGALHGQEGNVALVFVVAPTTAFGFGKGVVWSQTRWRF